MRQKDEMERTENARARSNRHILWLTYGIAALFIAMAVYFGWFIQFKSENVIGSSYNARLDLLSDRVTRGSIMSNDKTVLAQTNVASDGSEKRYYPYDYLFVHSVGYSGKNGKTGLESLANFYLLSSHVNLIEKTINEFQGKKNLGDNVITTLDVDLQQTASDAIGKYRGAVIVMEPDTGKILTMVSQPNFNANLVDERWAELVSPDNTKAQLVNRATQGLYPPGSTFKIITMSAGLSEGVVSPNDSFFCPGYKIVEDRRIHCHKRTGHGAENFVQGAQNSCNPVFIEVGLRLGVEKFCDYFRNFGLMEKTGIDLPGEASTIMHKEENIGEVELATMAFGQSFQITPIRLAATVSALVNGGKMVTPHVATDVLDEEGNVVKHLKFPEKEGVLSEETSRTVREILESVVSEGSGKNAYLEGYSIGVKTATSQTLPRSANRYISSFLGFTPAEHPTVLGLCIIRNPQGVYYGGTICAPVIRDIFSNVLPYLGIGHNS